MRRDNIIIALLMLPIAAIAANPAVISIVGPSSPKVTITDTDKKATITVIGSKPAAVTVTNPAAITATVITPGLPGPAGKDGTSGASSWGDIAGKPASYPPAAHEQTISTVTGLQTALTDRPTNAIFAGYTTKQRALITDPRFYDSRYPVAHDQAVSTITGLQTELDGKEPTIGFTPVSATDSRLSDSRTPLAHDQAISTVTGLQTALGTASTHISNTSNPHSTTASQTGAEPNLGTPDVDGKVLSSTAMGVRLWISPAAETRNTIISKISETPPDDTIPLHYKKSTGADIFSIDLETGTVTITGVLVVQ